MTIKEFALLLISILTSVAGQFCLKAGALKLGRVSTDNAISHVLNIATTPELIIGLACYGLGALAYILLLTRVNLSIAAPSISLVYVLSVILGYWFFREPVPAIRAVGLGFIVCGVILVAWQK